MFCSERGEYVIAIVLYQVVQSEIPWSDIDSEKPTSQRPAIVTVTISQTTEQNHGGQYREGQERIKHNNAERNKTESATRTNIYRPFRGSMDDIFNEHSYDEEKYSGPTYTVSFETCTQDDISDKYRHRNISNMFNKRACR